MSLRLKLIVALAVLASVASAAIGLSSYRTTRTQLLNAVDQSLDTAAGSPMRLTQSQCEDGRRPYRGLDVQVIDTAGTVVLVCGTALPIRPAVLRVAQARSGRIRQTATIDGEEFRILTVGVNTRTLDGAVQFARPLTETNSSLERIARRTLLAVLGVIVAAILLGWWFGRHLTRRLEQLTAAARGVASTGALDLEMPVGGRDEVGTLGASMQAMLTALAASRAAQRQLVQDAGHELRTPLTSLRTNISVLRRYQSLPDDARRQILDDLESETKELTALVNELVDLATDAHNDEVPQSAPLAEIAQRVAERAQRRSTRTVTVDADNSVAVVRVQAIERAIQNLVDNALKFSVAGPVTVTIRAGRIAVRDAGPGIPAGEERKIFERFHRSDAARSLPGSGLGLSIVASVAESHGGTVFAANVPTGGSEIGFTVAIR